MLCSDPLFLLLLHVRALFKPLLPHSCLPPLLLLLPTHHRQMDLSHVNHLLSDGKRDIAAADAANQRVQQEIAALRLELDELRDAASNQQKSADAMSLILVHQQTRSQALNAGIRDSEQKIAVTRAELSDIAKERDRQRDNGQKQTDTRILSLQEAADAVQNSVNKLLQLNIEIHDDVDADTGHDVSDERRD